MIVGDTELSLFLGEGGGRRADIYGEEVGSLVRNEHRSGQGDRG